MDIDYRQISLVVAHLKRYNTITSKEAFIDYGITRLSAVIFNMRKAGWVIETNMIEGKNRFGRPCRYAEYELVSEPPKKENKE